MNKYLKAFEEIYVADAWNSTAYDALADYMGEDDSFNGDIKEFNKVFKRGLYLAIEEPEKFKVWDEGFTEALGYSLSRIADVYLSKVEEEKGRSRRVSGSNWESGEENLDKVEEKQA